MLTRIEVDGFKNLHGVSVDLGPFTCVAGPNGIGKSNLFDAIRFLSLLADGKMLDAARKVRGADDDPTDPRDLFSRIPGVEQPFRPMTFAVEAIVPRTVRDSFGRDTKASITFLRYELVLAYEAATGAERVGHIRLVHERLRHINRSDAHHHLRWPHRAEDFRRAVVTGVRRGGDFISTATDEDGNHVIKTHQDGGSRGQPRSSPAAAATATVVGATNSVDDPTIFSFKTELRGWRHLALEPSAMRRPDKYWELSERSSLGDNGARIAATLWSLASSDAARADMLSEVARQVAELVPVRSVRIRPNDAHQQFELEVQESSGEWLGARALSEGTLRFLALSTLAADPYSARLVCLEEPENGIHPSRLAAMLELLDRIAVDPMEAPGEDNPVRQVLVNTHSPLLVQLLERQGRSADLLIAEPATVRKDGRVCSTVRFRHRAGTWREGRGGAGVGRGIAEAYLTQPPGGQVPMMVADGT